MKKIYLSADDLLKDSFTLARQIFKDGLRPDWIVGVWRGGAGIGVAVHEYFRWRGHNAHHCPIQTISYTGIAAQDSTVRVFGIERLSEQLSTPSTILIVDDVFDSGRSAAAVHDALARHKRVLAMPWYKPTNNVTALVPDYYLHTTEDWLVFPHELQGLTEEELLHKPIRP
jgi:uncharacterized protein